MFLVIPRLTFNTQECKKNRKTTPYSKSYLEYYQEAHKHGIPYMYVEVFKAIKVLIKDSQELKENERKHPTSMLLKEEEERKLFW